MTDQTITITDASSSSDNGSTPAPADPEAAIGDEAAEMDAIVPADSPADADPGEEASRFTGTCTGGPYDGRTVISRFPGGFMLFDKARSLVWTYGTNPADKAEFTSFGDGVAVTSTTESLIAAAQGVQLDVIAYDDGPAVT